MTQAKHGAIALQERIEQLEKTVTEFRERISVQEQQNQLLRQQTEAIWDTLGQMNTVHKDLGVVLKEMSEKFRV